MASREHILLDSYCIFCRSTALYSVLDRSIPESWEKDVFCFFEIFPNEKPGNRLARIFRMSSRKGFDVTLDSVLYKEVYDAGKLLCYDAFDGLCSLDHTANLAHIPCLQLAISKFPRITISSLCHLSKILQPVIAWDNARNVLETKPSVTTFPIIKASATELGSFLDYLQERLPNEVLMMICTTIPDGLFASLARCCNTLHWLELSGINMEETRRTTLFCTQPLSSDGNVTRLVASIVDLLGDSCLAKVGTDDSSGSHHEISLSKKDIIGVQFALGTYGVQGLRIRYGDGTVSAWLGEATTKWMKFVPGSNLQRLQIKTDGVRIVALAFNENENEQRASQTNVIRPIWDQDIDFPAGAKCSMIDLRADLNVSIRGNPKTRYAKYLDLSLRNGEGHSLTAFCSAKGICCIQFDADYRRKLGEPRGDCCVITFYLSPDEQIRSLHLVVRQSTELMFAQGPFLAVQTSRGRTLYYGAVLIPSVVFAQGYFARFDDDGSHTVSGIFSDPITSLEAHKSLGVMLKTTPVSQDVTPSSLTVPALAHFEPRRFLSKHREYTFLSKASFSGTSCLKVQKKGDRCVGLLAIMSDANIITLGQWNPSDSSAISIIYDEKAGPLKTITFLFSEGLEHERYIRHIIPNATSTSENHFHWGELDHDIIWLFTDHYDYCDYWKGTDMEIPVTASALPVVKVAV